ncbi:MAG: DUF3107 family protein [Actinobacteria bacterium]|uniref:Unannotated protein n=1 Tax=freshwater metagenome TaxID=449393 RepID=A0A6J7NMM6_9ZZZZ|nr:DUF3107 family protein [Actinomycetota bacterium]MSW91458.1 DUF3107 family protein [Actinomycetota bacterium]MSX86205.1 DUF3107 family protein [Actinomycetota bacterium]MSY70564.1 DUF3107 family protein [Actinomycetota bacterium]
MDVRIGVKYSAKEISVELADDADREALKKQIGDALSDEDNVLWLSDKRGRDVAVPAGKITYVEIGSSNASKPIGFGG